jgi:hypothetical protein
MSSVTDEDRENAIKVRQNALKSNGSMCSRTVQQHHLPCTNIPPAIDLAAIARSSVAVSGSPPKDGVIVSSPHVSEKPALS